VSALDPELDEAAAPASDPAGATRDWAWPQSYALALLTLIAMFNYLDRNLLGMVLPLVKAEMQLSDTVLGLVTGVVFVLFYSLLGVPIASLADRSNRRNIIAAGFGFWSLMTIVSGFCANVWQLAVTRFLMGAGEACSLAPSTSMISDLFPRQRRAMAVAVLSSSFALQTIAFSPVVGWLSDHYGWRTVFVASGVPGLAVAVLFFLTVREPARAGATAAERETAPLGAALRFLFGSPAFLLMVLAGAFMGGAIYGSGAWLTTFLVRVRHLSLTEIGAAYGPPRGVAALVGILLAGWLSDRLARADGRWRVWAPALCCLLLAPAQLLLSLSDAPLGWVGGMIGASFLLTAYQAPVYAAVMGVARPRMRAVAISVLVLTTGILGQVLGPLLIGALNDGLRAQFGDAGIRYSLLVIAGCGVGGALSLLAAGLFLEADSRRAAEA
jgi:MFS family permease